MKKISELKPMTDGLNILAQEVHQRMVEKGFYEDVELLEAARKDLSLRHWRLEEIAELAFLTKRFALIAGEANEGIEALRAGKTSKTFDNSESGLVYSFPDDLKDTFEQELIGIIVRCLDFAGYLKLDLSKRMLAELSYGDSRPKKHNKLF